MSANIVVDTTFDMRTDSLGRDPDAYSPTLRSYHKLLWSKPLPNGAVFELDDQTPHAYLHHRSSLGEFFLASDSVIPTFARWLKMAPVIGQIPEADREAFHYTGYTIGGMMLFPSNKIDGKQTINGARGFNPKIADRLDLTLECVRRYYLGLGSPLGETLARYADFFELFDNFDGYVKFFLLQDLVSEDCSAVEFFMPFDGFRPPAYPRSLEAYTEYRRITIEFINSRNHRIASLNK